MSEIKPNGRTEIQGDLSRCTAALRGLAGLFQSVGFSKDTACIDFEGVGDLVQILSVELDGVSRRVAEHLYKQH